MQIRHATLADLPALCAVEAEGFPPAEAAPRQVLEDRLRVYPDHFWLLEDGGRLVAFVDGMATDEPAIHDELFARAELHDARGAWQAIFGVVTVRERRGRGCAALLLRRVIADARAQGRRGCVLTCKAELVGYYERLGFVNQGRSRSVHGGAVWYDLRLAFPDGPAAPPPARPGGAGA